MRLAVWIVTVVGALLAIWVLSQGLVPPRSVSFAAGSPGSGYYAFAERYRTILARDGIDVTIVETAGSVENADLVARGVADVALVQGGITPSGPAKTLGAVVLEPVFLFVRSEAGVPANPALWRGLRVGAGGEGSGTRAAFLDFVQAAAIPESAVELVPVGGRDAAQALLAGEIDVAMFVAPISAGYLLPLMEAPGVTLLRLDNIQILSRRLPQSVLVDLPSGTFALDPVVPPDAVPMLSLAARLVAVRDLHPALVDRLVMAAIEIHGHRDAISGDAAFPTMTYAALPQDPYARDLIEAGPSPLMRYLPYWVVAQISRFAILLLPILFLLVPLVRAIPGLYVWRMRWRVFRHYGTIRAIDREAGETRDPARLRELQDSLDAIDREIAELNLPPAYRDFAYNARLHIDLVRKRIEAARGGGEA